MAAKSKLTVEISLKINLSSSTYTLIMIHGTFIIIIIINT